MSRIFEQIMVLWSLWFLLIIGTAGGRPPECTWSVESSSVTPSATEGVMAMCSIRTLATSLFYSDEGNSSLTWFNHARHITALTLKCARQVVFKSEIESAMFSIFQRLEDLTILNCKLTSLPDHSFSGLPHLRRLSVRSHHEDWPGASLEIEPYALSDLPRLEVLNLSYNNLWSLPPGNLCHLPSLATLNLTYNALHDLGDLRLGAAGGCSHPILHLYLDHNQISEIHQRGLEGAGNLRLLSLSNNHISHLEDHAFQGLFELRYLDLSVNNLVALPQTAFQHLQQLRELNLCNNSLSGLPPLLFQTMNHLLILNLNNNMLDIASNNEEPFLGLIRLVILDLSHNSITYINTSTFKDLYSLQVLHLSHNHITYLDDDTFSALSNLHTLELSNNEITVITSTAFRGLSVLTFLKLEGNEISEIHETAFDNCSSLQIMNLSKNKMTAIPKALNKIQRLRTLDLSFNKIQRINANDLNQLSQMVELYLHNNLLTNMSEESFEGLSNLRSLDLSHNMIEEIQNGTVSKAPNLSGLNVSHNHLKSLYGVAMFIHNLTWLNASHNSLEWFDYVVVPPTLVWIDISYNQLDTIGNHYKLADNLKLKILFANNNNLTEINGHSILNGIEEIYLENNYIDYIASNTFKDKNLIYVINLSNNKLSILGDSALRLSSETNALRSTLYLTDNILECDCGAEWLLTAAKGASEKNHLGSTLFPRLGDIANVKCRLPGIWDNAIVPVVTVDPQQFLCTYQRHCFSVCHCCEFDACDCEQTCPRNCSCYHDHTWKHNIVDCGEGSWTKMPSGVPMDVTEAYMDGNNIGALTSHALIGRKNLRMLYLNSSHITTIQNRTFNGLKNLLLLKLSNNFLEKLFGFEFLHLHNLVELHLDFNKLTFLGNVTFSSLRSLEVLKLDHNQLTSFPVWNLVLNPFLIDVSLNENPWSCECSYLTNFRSWLEANRIKTSNGSVINCFHTVSGELGPAILLDSPIKCDHYIASNNLGNLIENDYVMLITISIALLLLFICGTLIVFAYRRRLKLWAFTNYGKRLFQKSSYVEEREKLFDAFISHSAKDSSWVCGLLAPELEARGYRLCVAHRDCTIPSSPLTSQAIIESISCSRRVIIVVSKGFTDVEWCRYEFKAAHLESLRNMKRKNIIIIILEEIPASEFDTELNSIVKSSSAPLIPRDRNFWKKLCRALPPLKLKKRYQHVNGLGKAASHPLVPLNNQTGSAWALSETKTLPSVSNHSLTVNPYWETAITSVPDTTWMPSENGGICKPSWLTQITCTSHSPSREKLKDGVDHTYMAMSEYVDGPSLNTTTDAKIVSDSDTIPLASTKDSLSTNFNTSKFVDSQLVDLRLANGRSRTLQNHFPTSLLRQDRPDYLTRSWIFHPPPDQTPTVTVQSQTYFV